MVSLAAAVKEKEKKGDEIVEEGDKDLVSRDMVSCSRRTAMMSVQARCLHLQTPIRMRKSMMSTEHILEQ